MHKHMMVVMVAGSLVALAGCGKKREQAQAASVAPTGAGSAQPSTAPEPTGARGSGEAPVVAPADIKPEVLPPFATRPVVPRKPNGKSAVFKWDETQCHYSGTYDTGSYSASELEATHRLMQDNYWPFAADIFKTDKSSLEKEYRDAVASIQGLTIVADQSIEDFRAYQLNKNQRAYQLALSEVEYQANPARLRAHPGFEKCKDAGEPLVDGRPEAMRDALAKLQFKRNGNKNPPSGADEVRHDLLTVFWHDCVLNLDTGPVVDAQKLFKKVFKHVDETCDEMHP